MCRGVVQGVGFRPAVHRLATSLGLGGWVRNDADGATIEVEGRSAAVDSFCDRLPAALPPLARLEAVRVAAVAARGERGFAVRASAVARRRHARIPPDAALCEECRAEMEDPADRRHRYPFITCTSCGPRYSLTHALPYDRARTSMSCFPLCPACRSEYGAPGSRRFHAEPICCPTCGPRIWLANARGETIADGSAAVVAARAALQAGGIVAVKGLGGFQLACRADAAVVGRLRALKRRPTKPFAVMAPDLAAARTLVVLRPEDERLLRSPRGPILLAPRRPTSPVAAEVAPGIADLGVMLPTTPLHVELLRDAAYPALVMTSGNASDEPICRGNREACARLGRIADLWLLHDRDVVHRIDDSVVRATPRGHVVARRSRGWVPGPIALPATTPEPVLALGGHLHATACLAVGHEAYPSAHVGDLDTELGRDFLAEVADDLERFLDARARVLVADLHPDYPSGWLAARLAEERGGRVLRFQHHLAHAAAVLGEHGAFPAREAQVAALILDGTGWGPDGTAWGCEYLLVDGQLGWSRLAHGTPLPLVGGERAVREPWRIAAAALAAVGRVDLLDALPLAEVVSPLRLRQVAALARRNQWPLATGAGRVFEAAAALLGVVTENTWEGEAAARLESLASTCDEAVSPWPEVLLPATGRELPTAVLLVAAAQRVAEGEAPGRVAAGFHATFCRLAAALACRWIAPAVRTIALGGGCLINRLLRAGIERELEHAGLRPLLARAVPPGDGGLAYGQSVLAAIALARGVAPRQVGGA